MEPASPAPATARTVTLPPGVLELATAACERALDDDGTFTGVTTDVLPSWDIATYENCPTEPSPWGQGAAVRAFAALARGETPLPQRLTRARCPDRDCGTSGSDPIR